MTECPGGIKVLEFASVLGQRQPLFDAVESFCRQAGGDSRSLGRIRLVLDELFTNIVSYAHDDGGHHRVTVELAEVRPGTVSICLIDDGRPFDPLDRPPVAIDAPIEQRQVGGLGVHLVKTFMDACEYRREGDTNRLTLTKTFEPPGRPEDVGGAKG
jgi:anti-sigma regulatory factor (Ser/Thr protein kinase)